MPRCFKIFTMLFVLVFIFSLMGCSKESSKEKHELKTPVTAVKGDSEKNAKQPNVKNEVHPSSTQQVSTKTASEEKKLAPTPKQQITNGTKGSDVEKKAGPISVPKTNTKNETVTSKPIPAKTVTLSIMGPKDKGDILSATKVGVKDGETILDVLLHATEEHSPKIQVDYTGSGATAYINGINNIYEFDYGPKSGWLFKQNGVSLTKSIGTSKVKAGDKIECYYTQ